MSQSEHPIDSTRDGRAVSISFTEIWIDGVAVGVGGDFRTDFPSNQDEHHPPAWFSRIRRRNKLRFPSRIRF